MKKVSFVTQPSLKNIMPLILLLLVVVLAVWISLLQFRTPKVLPYSAKTDEFSAERAMNYLEEFAVKPHPIGTEEHDRVRDYLMTTLTNLGVSPEIQSVEGVISPWGVYEGKVENIVARIPGSDSSGTIMISSHYDSAEHSHGAADAGSGVAAILETVRILSASPALKNDVIVLITDGEESGLLGAQAFVDQHPWAQDISLVLNFEARGSEGPSVMFETNEVNGTLITEFVKGAPNPVASSLIYDLYKIMPNDTDFSIFKNVGMYGLNFGFFEGVHTYHTPDDNIENLSLGSLQHHGDYMLHLVQHFGNMNLIDPKPDKKIFFNLIGKNIVTYSEKIVTPIMIIAIIAFILSFVHGFKRKKLTLTGTSAGFLLFLFTISLAYLVGQGLWNPFSAIFPDRIWIAEMVLTISNPIFIGIIIMVFPLISLVYQLGMEKINVYNLTIGAYFGWLLLLVVTSIFFKGSSYVFAWPFLFGIIGINVLMVLKDKQSVKGYAITIGFMIPVLLITVPILYLVYTLFGMNIVGILLALSSLLIAFIIPLLNLLKIRFTIGLSVTSLIVVLVMLNSNTLFLK